jgi:RNA polymerase sigma-70 factor (sigma-E family)
MSMEGAVVRTPREAARIEARHAVIELYGVHFRRLVRLASLLERDPHQAEDLVQEAFARLFRAWGRLGDPAKAPEYLRSTVVNLARGRARRGIVARRFTPDRGADAASAEDVAARLAEARFVVAVVRSLPTRQRECIVLRHYEGCTESEIAAIVGCSIGTVRTHLKRARETLTRELRPLRTEELQ